jgi:thiamine pyrophosphate-dependent acetolactate synthase large subunit-like protein
VTDGGRFITEVWARISVPDPRSFVFTANFGSIGLGLQEAIGAAATAPERTAVLFTGDGGFMMGGINELNTAVRAGLNVVVIVANDSAYGAEHIQFVDRKMDPSLSEFDWPSFSEVAKSLGAQAVSINCDSQLDKALELIHHHRGPRVIELCLHPEDVPRMRA